MTHNPADKRTGVEVLPAERTSAVYISVASLFGGLAVPPEDDPTMRWLFDG